jgi:hypothetical protein
MDMALQMIVFMLDDAGANAFEYFFVLLKVFVKVFDTNLVRANPRSAVLLSAVILVKVVPFELT